MLILLGCFLCQNETYVDHFLGHMGCVQYRHVCKCFAKFPISSTRLLRNVCKLFRYWTQPWIRILPKSRVFLLTSVAHWREYTAPWYTINHVTVKGWMANVFLIRLVPILVPNRAICEHARLLFLTTRPLSYENSYYSLCLQWRPKSFLETFW